MKSPRSHRPAKVAGRITILGLATGILLPLLAGCPGTLPEDPKKYPGAGTGSGGMMGTGTGGAGGAVVGCDAPTTVFQRDGISARGCLGSTCHSGVFPPDFRTATKATLATMMAVGGSANGMTMLCKGDLLVNTANPSASVILKRVQGNSCGDQMPDMVFQAMAYLTQPEIDCVAAWVAAP